MTESPQSHQAPSSGASFIPCAIEWLACVGSLLSLPALVLLPPYVVTRLYLVRKAKQHVLVPVRVRR